MNSTEDIFSILLWFAGMGHFCILGASFQVPYRLNWKEDLAKLTPFNRKLMWVYGAFTVMMIASFGGLTLVFHDELLRGDRVALGLASLIGLFWTVRLLVDFFVFSHADWPRGAAFVVGHILLTIAFSSFSLTYLGLVIWHLWFR